MMLGHDVTHRIDRLLDLFERYVGAKEKDAATREKMAETDEARRRSGR